MTGTIHLVRHGRVENPTGVIYGRLPGYHLSEVGRAQAERAADRLAGSPIGVMWASPLERAQETAAIIASRHDALEIVTDERLIESATTLEGVSRTLLALATSPKHWWSLRNPLKPSWGETYAEVRGRMLEAIAEAFDEASGSDVVFVSHQTPVVVARSALARRWGPPWLGGPRCSTGSISTIELREGRAVTASYFVPSF